MQHYQTQNLPVEALFEPLKASISDQQQFVVEAPPGAGKSTALPLFLLLECQLPGLIILLEPRRIAARSIARYLARQLGESLGERVGYRMRGEGKQSSNTRLLVVTEGVLTRMLQSDPELSGVSLVIFDEFHERSLHADLGLALCLEVQQAYNEALKVMVMSATLNSAALSALMPNSQVFSSEGRSFPITYHYHAITRDYQWSEKFAQLCVDVFHQFEGSMLVFLPGASEINDIARRLQHLDDGNCSVHRLYGQLSLDEQQAAINVPATGRRKIVLSTNIAETSLTIDGVDLVIDSGLERFAQWHAKSSSMHLSTRLICRDSATQRAGRAGRLKAGHCFRAYTQAQFEHQPAQTTPAIERSDLSELSLELACWGASADELTWLSRPPQSSLDKAKQLLLTLGMLDGTGDCTAAGRQAMQLPIGLRMAAMLVLVDKQLTKPLLRRAIFIAAVLESGAKLEGLSLEDRLARTGQLCGQARRQIEHLEKQLLKIFQVSSQLRSDDTLDGVLLSYAYGDHIAMSRSDGELSTSSGFGVKVRQWNQLSSSDKQKLNTSIVIDLYWPEGRTEATASLLCPLDLDKLELHRPALLSVEQRCFWDNDLQRVVARDGVYIGRLCLQSKAGTSVSNQDAAKSVIDYWKQRTWSELPVSDAARRYLKRCQKAKLWFELEDWPNLEPEYLCKNLELWLEAYLSGVKTLKSLQKIDWLAAIKALLTWPQQQQLEQLLPLRYTAPSGRSHAIDYSGEQPKVSLKLQEVFGEPCTPKLGKKVGITLELLSPAQRPLQLTQDLASFWQNAYPMVKKEMKGRYPKHPWPDDPTNAVASHLTKRKLSPN